MYILISDKKVNIINHFKGHFPCLRGLASVLQEVSKKAFKDCWYCIVTGRLPFTTPKQIAVQ